MVTSECCFCVRRLTALSALALTCLVFGANGVMHESPEKNPGCIGPETAFSLYGSTRRGWSKQLTFDIISCQNKSGSGRVENRKGPLFCLCCGWLLLLAWGCVLLLSLAGLACRLLFCSSCFLRSGCLFSVCAVAA